MPVVPVACHRVALARVAREDIVTGQYTIVSEQSELSLTDAALTVKGPVQAPILQMPLSALLFRPPVPRL